MRMLCGCMLAAAIGLAAPAWGAPKTETRHVSVVNLPLKSAPDGLSTSVGLLSYGEPVTVLSAVRSDFSPPAQKPQEEKKKNKEKNKRAAAVASPLWLRVSTTKGEGYVPEGATVTQGQFTNQSHGNAAVGDVGAAGRGFSESEDADLAAVKGAGGSAEAGSADYAQLDKIVAEKPVEDEQAKHRDFRQTGKLGEYKQAEARP